MNTTEAAGNRSLLLDAIWYLPKRGMGYIKLSRGTTAKVPGYGVLEINKNIHEVVALSTRITFMCSYNIAEQYFIKEQNDSR